MLSSHHSIICQFLSEDVHVGVYIRKIRARAILVLCIYSIYCLNFEEANIMHKETL